MPNSEPPASAPAPDAVLKALADPHRRQILRLVRHRELAAGQIAAGFALTQQAVSQHITVLKQAGLLTERRDGTRRLYSLRHEALDPVRSLTATIRVAAPPEMVFPYFTDPALIVTWIGDHADLDPRPGGIFAVDVGTSPARGTYLAVEPPTRVVFTWGLPGDDTMPAGSTTVEVALTADGDATVVSLTHHDLPAGQRPGHQKGWDAFLGALPTAVTRR